MGRQGQLTTPILLAHLEYPTAAHPTTIHFGMIFTSLLHGESVTKENVSIDESIPGV